MTFEDVRSELLRACDEGEQNARDTAALRAERGYSALTREDDHRGVYVLLDAEGAVLYVGCSRSPASRLYAHMRGPFGERIASWTMRWTSEREAGLSAERWLIKRLDPECNLDWKGGVYTRPNNRKPFERNAEAA